MEEGTFTLYDLYTADECFLTGTAAEIVPVVECDARKIGTGKPGEITRQLIDEFRRRVQEEGTPIYSGANGSTGCRKHGSSTMEG